MKDLLLQALPEAIGALIAAGVLTTLGILWRLKKKRQYRGTYDLYISYPMPREQDAIQLKTLLEDNGLRAFKDRDLSVGVDYQVGLDKAMKQSKAIGFCISPETKMSNGQQQEIGKAISLLDKKKIYIIPILLPGSNYADIPDAIKTYMCVDLRSGVNGTLVKPFVEALKHQIAEERN
jgi:hypothetical protein